MDKLGDIHFTIATLVVLTFACLAFSMIIGLTLFQAGMVRSKHVTSVLLKNIAGFALVSTLTILYGHHIIYGVSAKGSFITYLKNVMQAANHSPSASPYTLNAAIVNHITAAPITLAIIAGITAERLKLWAYLLFTLIMAGFIFPIQASWLWGQGFLAQMGFIDHNGASIIFLAGAVAGFTGSKVLGPRLHKTNHVGIKQAMPASNIPLACIGTFFIILGSYGILGSIYFAGQTVPSAALLANAFLNLFCACCGGILSSLIVNRIFYGTADLTLVLNGSIGGVVAILASPTTLNSHSALLVGAIAGILVIISVALFERFNADDPCGFLAVFGVGSLWSLVACAFTQNPTSLAWYKQLAIQCSGSFLLIAWVGFTSLLTWLAVDYLMDLRANKNDESLGLDIFDCGMKAYPEFTSSAKIGRN